MTTPSPLLEVVDLDVAYRHGDGWARVLHKVSFRIGAGEAFGLVGESGCGKSTAAYQLLGYRRPNSLIEGGKVLFKGCDLLALERHELDRLRGNRISLVPQNPTTALSPGMRVGHQITEVLRTHRAAPNDAAAEARMIELFRLVGLPDPERVGRRYPHQLSGGQQQRVTIAMALACDPDLLVLDEPTTGLDVTTQEQIIALLIELRARIGLSMLYVTHDLGVLAQIADRVGVMYAGHMVEMAPTEMLFRQPRHPYTRGLIASVPQLEAVGRPTERSLKGLLRRDELPTGCPFQPRCAVAEPSCAGNRQRLEPVAPRHDVACQRWRAIGVPDLAMVKGEAPAVVEAAAIPLLSLDGVTLGYGGARGPLARLLAPVALPVVQDLSFRIDRGETFALVGESGSGKSTVARAVSGLIEPLAGAIRFEGEALPRSVGARSSELRRRIQYIFQNPDASLNPRMRVGAILARPLEIFQNLDGAAIRERIARALDEVRLEAGYAARFPDQLSGGERQRVAIARALVADPDLLLCDEILSALDVSVQASILDLLARLRQEHAVAMLFISHDLAVVRALADRVGVLYRGQLMEIGPAAEIFTPPFHPYTHALLMAAPGIQTERRPPATQRLASAPVAGNKGCVFAGRCPWQVGRLCEEVAPPWQLAGRDLRIRCHIPLDELSARAVWRPDREGPRLAEPVEPSFLPSKSRAAPR
ncbi:ABC transporter ATP-binding protein [Rhodospirillaceae bacterium SYSU D60014]|uniref:dipeptide ABC transporter ATP-binding protein n=1 Tax=Virgifigura deserti TaxID=2268457 RepID=UPI000E672A05